MRNRKVTKKIIRKMDVEFISPVCVSNGEDEFTDADVMVDYDNHPFIPGSSLAGAMRDYLRLKEGIGSVDGDMSSFFISDLNFNEDVFTSIRDGIQLDKNKQTIEGNKYDMEVINAGAQGSFYMELVVREKDDENLFLEQWNQVLSGFQCHDIRLGAKKTRGYGECVLRSVKERIFTAENIGEYESVYEENPFVGNEILDAFKDASSKLLTVIKVPLELQGGISIRTYSAKKGEPDFSQITGIKNKPVIPGTSLSGALRHRILKYLVDDMRVNEEKALSLIQSLFGLKGDVNEEGHKSMIRFSEEVIKNSKPLRTMRTAISRFEFSSLNGALYTEKTFVKGNVELNIQIEKCEDWMIGLLLIALHDLQNGYLAIGGQTAIGRGLFKGDTIFIDDEVLLDETKYYDALVKEVQL